MHTFHQLGLCYRDFSPCRFFKEMQSTWCNYDLILVFSGLNIINNQYFLMIIPPNCLSIIYNLPGVGYASSQSEADCTLLSNLLQSFANDTGDTLLQQALGVSDTIVFERMSNRGCYILRLTRVLDDRLFLYVLGLDKWKFCEYKSVTYAECEGTALVHCGVIDVCDVDKVKEEFHSKMAEAEKSHGDKRNAGANDVGNQKTPGFVAFILRKALGIKSENTGGFTDVGMHTGTVPRNTSWFLVRELVIFVMRNLMHKHDTDVDIMLYKFHLWVSRQIVQQLSTSGTSKIHADMYDNAMTALTESARIAESLRHRGYDIGVDEFASIRTTLDTMYTAHQTVDSNNYMLQRQPHSHFSLSDMPITLPTLVTPAALVLTEDEIEKRASANLDYVILPIPLDSTPEQMYQWMTWVKFETSLSSIVTTPAEHQSNALLVVENVTKWFCHYASKLTKDTPIESAQISHLFNVLVKYIKHVRALLNVPQSHSIMPTQLSSRIVLYTWISYCLVHQSLVKVHAILDDYDIPLRYQDLGHLVITDPIEIGACSDACKYIDNYTRHKSPVFSLLSNDSTFQFASRIAETLSDMVVRYQKDYANCEHRKKKHWEAVEEKQVECKRLRARIVELTADKSDTETRKSNEHRYNCNRWSCTRHCDDLGSQISDLSRRIVSTNSDLTNTLQSPIGLAQCIPQNRSLAMRNIFFYQMPETFRILSQLSFSAQQLIVENRPIDETVTDRAETDLAEYYNTSRSPYSYHEPHGSLSHGVQGDVSLWTTAKVPDMNTYGPRSVDNMYRTDQGVYYPDDNPSLDPVLKWSGCDITGKCSGRYLNPWKTSPNGDGDKHYTEQLQLYPKLQWCMVVYKDTRVKSNVPYASQHLKPSTMRKCEYEALTKLRAFPNSQLRNVATAIRCQEVPLTDTDVHTVLRMALYHLGDIDVDGGQVTYKWKHDLHRLELSKCMTKDLANWADRIANSPKEHESVPICGEISSFLVHYNTEAALVSKSLASIAYRWSRERSACVSTSDASIIAESRAQEALYLMYAMACYGIRDIDADDAALMLKIIVLIRYLHCYCDHQDFKERLNSALIVSQRVMAHHASQLSKLLSANKQYITDAIRLVIETAPITLEWSNLYRYSLAKTDGIIT